MSFPLEGLSVQNLKSTLFIAFFTLSFLAVSSVSLAADRMYEQALQSYQQQKYDEAYVYLKNSLQNNEKNLPSKLLLGKLFVRNGFYQDAIKEFKEALALKIDIELILLPLGNVLLFNEQYEDVLALGKGYELTPESKFEWRMLSAAAYSNLGQPLLAHQAYQDALKIYPKSIRALNSLAYTYLSDNQIEKAQFYLSKSLKINPSNEKTWHLSGKIAEANDNNELAISHYKKGLQLSADDPVLSRSLAYALVAEDKLDEARQIADKIITQTPDDPFAMLLNSWLHSKAQEQDMASSIIENLSNQLTLVTEEQYQKKDSLLFVKGMTAYIQGDFEQARRSLSRYIKRYSQDLNAVSMLAEIYSSMGQDLAAMHLLENIEAQVIESLPQALTLANLYLQNNKDFKAEYILSEMRKRYPAEVQVVLMSAKALAARGKIEEAIRLVADSETQFPNAVSLKLARGVMYVQNSQFDAALDISKQLIKLDAQNPDFFNLQGASYIRLGELDKAEVAIAKVLKINPQHFVGRFNQAMIHKHTGRLDDAKTALLELTEEQPRNTNALFQLAFVESQLGDLESAIQRLEELTILEQNNHKILGLLINLYSQNGRHFDALSRVRKATRDFPLHPDFAIKKAEILIDNRKIDEAKEQLSALYNLWLDNPEKLFRLSSMQQQVEDYQGASDTLQKALSFQPKHLLLNLEFARLNIQLGQQQIALSVLDKMQKQYGDNANILLLHGDIHMHNQALDKAYQAYSQAVDVEPSYRLPLTRLYELARKGINPDKFHKLISSLLEATPKNHWQRKLLADHLMNSGDWALAETHYKILLEEESLAADFTILNNLANIYFDKDPNQALLYARKALKLAPTNSAVLDTYGWLLTALARYDDAITHLRQAHAIDSKDPSIRYHIAYTLNKLSRTIEAKAELEDLIEAYPVFPEREQARALLASI